MEVIWFLQQRTALIRHFYDAAAAPFIETKRQIEAEEAPYDDPPYDESGEPAFLSEWLQADVEHELIGRAAVSMLSEALKQFFVTNEKLSWPELPCAKCFKKEFANGFIDGYVACFGPGFGINWSKCPADLSVLKQVVLARNRAQHPDLIVDHLPHDKGALEKHPKPFFIRPEDEGQEFDGTGFLAPNIHISRDKLFAAIEQVDLLTEWLQDRIDDHLYPNSPRLKWPK